MKIINDLNENEDEPTLIYDAICAYDNSRKPEGKTIRVTQLIDSPYIRSRSAEVWDKLEVPASRLWHSFMGSMGHEMILEKVPPKPPAKTEVSMKVEFEGWTITGTADYVNSKTKTILDIKFTGTSQRSKHRASWDEQLNVYAWLVWKTQGWYPEKLLIAKGYKNHSPYAHSFQPAEHLEIGLWGVLGAEDFIRERLASHEAKEICRDYDRWASDEVYAVMKNSNVRAVKLFDKMDDAISYAQTLAEQPSKTKNLYTVVTRPKEYGRCNENFCDVYHYCERMKEEL